MLKDYLQKLRIFLPVFIVMLIGNQAILAAEDLVFTTGPQAASKFWNARERYNVQLASIHHSTEGQAKSEIKRIVQTASDQGINLLTYPLFGTKVSNEEWGYCAVGVFYNQDDAQVLANKLRFLGSNPIVRQPATTTPALDFIIYRDPTR